VILFENRGLRLLAFSMFGAGAMNCHAADLFESWQAAQSHDATYSAASHALAAGQEKARQGDSMVLPQVSLSANTGRTQNEEHYGNPAKSDVHARGQQYGSTISLSQPIYDASAFYGREQLKVQSREAEIQFRLAKQDLILRVAKAYFDVNLAQENVHLVAAEKSAIAQQLAQAKKTFSVGASTITDTNDAQARFDAIVASELSAQNDLQVKQAAYQQLTNLDPENLSPLTEGREALPPTPAEPQQWLEQARSESLNVIAQQLGLQVSNIEIKLYRLASSPKLALVASYDKQWDGASTSYPGYTNQTNQATIGLQLTIPLFTGGYRSSKHREAVELAAQQRDTLEATIRDAQQTARQSFLGVQTGAAQIKALEQARISSASSLASSKVGRDVGVRTTVDVLNAQQTHYQNLYNLVYARYQYLLSKLQLSASVGQLNEHEFEDVNSWFVTTSAHN
jgi:outer membrane protein